MKKNTVGFRLMVITDRKSATKSILQITADCVNSGVKAIQLREKDLTSRELLSLARKLRKAAKVKLIINDRLDFALLSGADGVHSPENGLKAKYIKKFGIKMLAGRSVHSKQQAIIAEKEGFDYVLFGPVFRTASKVRFGAPQGLEKLKQVCNSVKIPVFAVGGITPSRARKMVAAGAYGIAALGAVIKSDNVKKTIGEFKKELGEL